jgi:gliding motility-associated-like protein/uncharacterized repeat protein (TIGR01451 family)
LKRSILILILSILAVTYVAAQDAFTPTVGDTYTYRVNNHPGNGYEWKIYGQLNPLVETNAANFSFESAANLDSIQIKWIKTGAYYLLVTETGANGCTNTKAIRIEAVAIRNKGLVLNLTSSQCYSATLNDVQVNLTFKDGNDNPLGGANFPITVNYTLNGTAQTAQTVSYANQYITIPGSALASNPLSDTNNTIVITGATDISNQTIQPVTDAGQNTHAHIIYGLPSAALMVSDATICSGGTAAIILSGSVPGVNYQLRLDNDDSNVGSAQAGTGGDLTFTVSPVASAAYNILATNTATNCSVELSDQAVVTVNPLPTLTVSGTACSPDFTTYTINFTSDGTVTSTAGTVSGSQVSGIPAGVNVTLTATLNGCTTTQNVTAPDCSCPPVAAPISGGDQAICSGEAIPALTVTVGPGETADWYATATGGAALLTGNTSYTPAATLVGIFTYYAETRNTTSNCKSSIRTAVSLTVNPLPTLTVSGTVCSPDFTTYTINFTSDGTVTSTAGTVSGSQVSGIPAGVNVTLTATLNGCTTTQNVTAPDCSCPPVAAPISGGDQAICSGEAIPALTVTVGPGETADWYATATGGTALQSGNLSYVSAEPATGSYTYYAETRNSSSGCKSSTRTAVTLTVNPLPTLTVSGTVCSPDFTTYTINFTSDGTVTSTAGTVSGSQVSGIPAGVNVTLTATLNGCTTTQNVTAPDCSCPPVAAPISGGDQAICSGEAIPALTVTVGPGETADWYGTATGGAALLTDNTSYTPSETEGGMYVFYAETRTISTNCKSPVRTAVVLTIDALPVGGVIAGGGTVPAGANNTELTLLGHFGTVDRWQESTDGGVNWTDIANTTTSLTVINLSQTTQYRAVITNGVCPSVISGTATVTVTGGGGPVNRPPVAMNDINNTLMNSEVSGNVLTNDSDPDGDTIALILTPYAFPSNGTVALKADGTYTYTPDKDFIGEDFFLYVICEVGTNPVLCDTAIVTIEVRPNIPGNREPVANEDEFSTSVNQAVSGDVLMNDFDPDMDNLTISGVTSNVKNGVLDFRQDGTFTYTPNAGFEGTDQFIYELCDDASPSLCSRATVTITVKALGGGNNAPFAADDAAFVTGDPVTGNVSLNDSDPDGDDLTFTIFSVPSKGTVSMKPDGAYEYILDEGVLGGSDQFVYQVCDDGEPVKCNKATVYVTIIVNRSPLAVDDDLLCLPGETKTGNVLINDSDPDEHDLTVKTTPVSGPFNGTVTLSANGSFSYTPNAGFSGKDSVKYEVCDNGVPVKCTQALVLITIEDTTNVDRQATNDINSTIQNQPVSGNVLTNDDDYFEAKSVTTLYTQPLHGSVLLNANGAYTYTPESSYSGEDYFQYVVCTDDPPADCDTMKVTITVVKIKNGPVANNDETETVTGTPVTSNLLSNDYSPSGEPMQLNVQPVSGPSYGSVVISPDGNYTYTPANGFSGTDQFTYEVCGQLSEICSRAVVSISVRKQENNLIFAADDAFFTYGTAVSGNILSNDIYQVSTLQLNLSPLNNPLHGTVVINADGSFTYTPNDGYEGVDHFVYEICDRNSGICDNATVSVTVLPAPVQYADLAITKTAPPILRINEEITFELQVTNLGNSKAVNVRIGDYLPGYIKNAVYRIGASATSRVWTNTLSLGDLEVNQSVVIYITGIVGETAPETITNLSSVVSDVWDPNFVNNIAVAKTTVNRSPKIVIAGGTTISLGCCNTEGVIIDASQSAGETTLRYRWEPAIYLDDPTSAKPRFIPGGNTEYTLTVTDENGLKSTETIRVQIVDCPDAVTDGLVFVESPTTIIIADGSESTGAGISFRWWTFDGIILNGQTNSTAQISGLGKYYLEVTDIYGCSNIDSLIVGQYIQAIADTAEMDLNKTIDINVVANDIPQGDIDPSSISIKDPPDHGLAVVVGDSLINYTPDQYYAGTDEFVYVICDYFQNCDEATVLVIINDQAFFVPNAFSPNGDGVNDRFEVVGIAKYNRVKIEIINRWGNAVYKSENYGLGEGKDGYWDGTANAGLRLGQGPVPAGTYFYIMQFDNGEKVSGSVYLDR